MSQWDVAYASEQFDKHRPLLESAKGSSEATTRLRAIDTLLFDVLGWDRACCESEKHCRDEGFADYAMMKGEDVVLVVEAKKSGATFVLPNTCCQIAPIGLSLIASECRDAERALRQALGYAASLGARYIAITNGVQWILALTFVPNQRFEQRSVFVFESLDLIRDNFRDFFEVLSPDSILGNRPADRLLESRKAPAPAKLSSSIINYPIPASRNYIANELYASTSAVLDEVRLSELDQDFLRNCYVSPRSTTVTFQQARELVSTRLSLDAAASVTPLSPNEIPKLIGSPNIEKPTVVLGKVGHGKSTFLKYFRKVQSKDLFDQYIQIDIDFLDRPDSSEQVGKYIYDSIEEDLLQYYEIDIRSDRMVRGFLHTELERFKDTYEGRQFEPDSIEWKQSERRFVQDILQDRHNYLSKVFKHLKYGRLRDKKGYSVAVFLDNLDRRNDSIQEEAFLRASAMARDWSALVFICLRPSTYHRSRHFGVMDSVAPRLVVVNSPKTSELVSRRLNYARDVALGTVSNSRSGGGAIFSKDIAVQLPSTAPFLAACAKSFTQNRELGLLFDAVSNGNARDLLAYVHKVITSLHLDTKKINDKIGAGGYIMPEHEALRAMLYGDYMHYAPEHSVFINLFDLKRADPVEHFTKCLILRHLSQVPNDRPHNGSVTIAEVLSHLYSIGYSEEHSKECVAYLFEKRCLEGDIPSDEWSADIKKIRITNRGSYMIKSLVREFNYYDAIVVDTPILNPEVRKKIQDVFPIEDRLKRGSDFLDYLQKCADHIQDASAKGFLKSTIESVQNRIKEISLGRR